MKTSNLIPVNKAKTLNLVPVNNSDLKVVLVAPISIINLLLVTHDINYL